MADADSILDWRNDSVSRAMSLNGHLIERQDHVMWLEHTLRDPGCILLLAESDGVPVGQVRFDLQESEAQISLTVAPGHRGHGLARQLIQVAVGLFRQNHPRTPILAVIKMENERSKRAFSRCGFIRRDTAVVRGVAAERWYLFAPEGHAVGERASEERPLGARIEMAGRGIGRGNSVYIVAELSANHNQKKEIAIETIKAAQRAGADAVKLQTYTPDTLTIDCDNEYFQIKGGTPWDGKTLYQLYHEAYTPWEWHGELFRVAREEGLICFSTPFDKTAVDFLEQFDPPAYKIASFEIQDIALIAYAASKGRPMILSTGIAELEDIDLAVQTCRTAGNEQIVLLKCTSAYPAPIADANLLTIPNLRETFGVEVGLSDHTLGSAVPVVAVALGATIIEKHFILDRAMGGPDAAFSLDEREFRLMVQAVREAQKALGRVSHGLSEKAKASRVFGRSLFVVEDIPAGDTFTEANVRCIRPGYGLAPKHLPSCLGRKATCDIKRGTPLTWSLVEGNDGRGMGDF